MTSTAVCSHLFTCSSEAVEEPEAGPKALETCLIELDLVFVSFLLLFLNTSQPVKASTEFLVLSVFVSRLHACGTMLPHKIA